MTGTGEVTKKRLKEGAGEFPIDCPLHDTTVRVHYRARRAAHQHPQQEQQQPGEEGGDTGESAASAPEGAGERPWLFDSRSLQQEPLSVDTGRLCWARAVALCCSLRRICHGFATLCSSRARTHFIAGPRSTAGHRGAHVCLTLGAKGAHVSLRVRGLGIGHAASCAGSP